MQRKAPEQRSSPRFGYTSLSCFTISIDPYAVSKYSPQHAAEHVVGTRRNEWTPVVLFIDVGDSIVFTGMESHETELIAGLHPEGVAAWKSELNEEGFTVTFDRPGAYVYKCHVHLGAGMYGAIVVGPQVPENLEAIDNAESALPAEQRFIERVVARMKREIDRRQRAQR